jgi:V/A-type H+-transporting ATPase subunit I
VALLFHALNLALGALSPTIHSLRLHYVEFFRKFYTGGGQGYQPFGG